MIRRLILPIVLGAALVAVPAAGANTHPLTLKQGRKQISAIFWQEVAWDKAVSTAHIGHCHRTGRRTVVCNTFIKRTTDGVTEYCHKYYRAHRGRMVVESRTGRAPWYKYTPPNCHE